jgi:replicative DNA helicase
MTPQSPAVRTAHRHFIPAVEVAAHVREEVELRHAHPDMCGLRTGMATLDACLSDALNPGSLILLVGESGRGKTTLAQQLALAAACQMPTAVLTMEDSMAATVKRQLANITSEDVGAIRRGFAGTENVPQAFYDGLRTYDDLALDYLNPDGLTVEAIAISAKAWARERCVGASGGVLIIDQLSHIAPSDPRMNDYFMSHKLPFPPAAGGQERHILEWQSLILKIVAQRLNLTVILLHQLNETHDSDARPTIRSVRESRGIAHKADAIIAAHRPRTRPDPFAGPGQPARVPNHDNYAEIVGIKGRNVEEFVIECRFDGAHQRFVDPTELEHPAWRPTASRTPSAIAGARKLAQLIARFDAANAPRTIAATLPRAIEARAVPTSEVGVSAHGDGHFEHVPPARDVEPPMFDDWDGTDYD